MKRFLAQFALFAGVQLLILVFFLSMFFFVRFEKDPMAAITDKEQLLKETPSPRLIVVGDSGVPFGIVSPDLKKAFPERHPINAGLAAGFGHRVLLGEVEPEVREGDVIVICFVYDMFDRNLLNAFFYLLLGEDPDIITSLDERDFIFLTDNAYMLIKNAMRHTRKVAFNPLDKEFIQPYARDSYNEYGDIDAHYDMVRPPERNRNIQSMDFEDLEYAHEAIADINEFAADAEARGAKVFFLFPDVSEESYERHHEQMNALAAVMREELKIPMLNTPEEAVQPEVNFYDTPYHLGEAGARDRTERLIKALQAQGVN